MKTIWTVALLLLTFQIFAEDALDRWFLRDARPFNRVRFVGGLFVAVGDNGTLATSEDGITWIARDTGVTAKLAGVAYGLLPPTLPPTYVVVGSGGTFLKSPNGTNWTQVVTTNTCDLNDVAWGESSFVAVTTRELTNQPNALRSLDATNWTAVTFPGGTPQFPGGAFWTTAIAYGGGAFVAAGGYPFALDLWRSTSGSTWTPVANSDQFVGGIGYGDGRFLVVGWEGRPRCSPDAGVSWFVVGDTNICNPYPSTCMAGSDVAYGNSTFLIVRSFVRNGILSSTDTTNWVKRAALSGLLIESAAFGKGTFVAAGHDGIYQSESVSTPILSIERMQGTNTLLIRSSGEVGRGYRLQSSTNLTSWIDVLGFTNTLPTIEFFETPDPTVTGELYRVVSP